ncbi:MAG: hypothetical protein COA78_21245 [Blastopirellula sp.]|nr:MAG: hypothetical protein COA78_21245 [Blastopirellula sp.]
MSESKECHLNNDSILNHSIRIFDQAERDEKKYLKSSHGEARRLVDRLKCDILPPEVNSAAYFDELLKGGH